MKQLVYLAYRFVFGYSSRAFLKQKQRHTIAKRIRYYLQGYWADSLVTYDFQRYDRSFFVTDFARVQKLSQINARFSYVINDKLVTEKLVPSMYQSVAYITNGVIKDINHETTSLDSIVSHYGINGAVIIKPRLGGGGGGINKVKNDKNEWSWNGKEMDIGSISDRIKKLNDCMIYPCLVQSGFPSKVYPGSLNTIRVLSIINPITGAPELIQGVHRFGTKQSGHVDNISAGGICANVELETGELSVALARGKDFRTNRYVSHPDTNTKIENEIVPHWKDVVSLVLSAHRILYFLPSIGWDVAVVGDEVVIIEANSNSELDIFQMHKPLLMNEVYRKFLMHHKVIRDTKYIVK